MILSVVEIELTLSPSAAIMTEVPQTGQRYLQVRHFLTRGIPSSFIAFAVIVTIGYGLMYVAGL